MGPAVFQPRPGIKAGSVLLFERNELSISGLIGLRKRGRHAVGVADGSRASGPALAACTSTRSTPIAPEMKSARADMKADP
jgi:hypothetical protein